MEEQRNAYRIEGKRPLGGLRPRWLDNMKMELR
jgi:hypothetical protein